MPGGQASKNQSSWTISWEVCRTHWVEKAKNGIEGRRDCKSMEIWNTLMCPGHHKNNTFLESFPKRLICHEDLNRIFTPFYQKTHNAANRAMKQLAVCSCSPFRISFWQLWRVSSLLWGEGWCWGDSCPLIQPFFSSVDDAQYRFCLTSKPHFHDWIFRAIFIVVDGSYSLYTLRHKLFNAKIMCGFSASISVRLEIVQLVLTLSEFFNVFINILRDDTLAISE